MMKISLKKFIKSDEIKVQTQRENHIETVKEYMKSHCDLKANMRDSVSLSEIKTKGIRQLMVELSQ